MWTVIPAEAVEAALLAFWSAEDSEQAMHAALVAAAPHMARSKGGQCILEAAADEAEGVISSGDVAECAAYLGGSGREEAISNRDALYEGPASWLRGYAARFNNDEFNEWHDEHSDECPACNPHVCDDYCHNCEDES